MARGGRWGKVYSWARSLAIQEVLTLFKRQTGQKGKYKNIHLKQHGTFLTYDQLMEKDDSNKDERPCNQRKQNMHKANTVYSCMLLHKPKPPLNSWLDSSKSTSITHSWFKKQTKPRFPTWVGLWKTVYLNHQAPTHLDRNYGNTLIPSLKTLKILLTLSVKSLFDFSDLLQHRITHILSWWGLGGGLQI